MQFFFTYSQFGKKNGERESFFQPRLVRRGEQKGYRTDPLQSGDRSQADINEMRTPAPLCVLYSNFVDDG